MHSPSPELSVIVVNYNARVLLEACLTSIRDTAGGIPYEILVMDNASRDGSVGALRERFREVTWVANEQNLGYTKANNQGLALARGQYLLLLNNDTVVLPGALEGMVCFLRERPRAGVVGCKVQYPDGTIQATARTFPRPINALFGRRSLLTRLFPDNPVTRRYIVSRDGGPEEPVEVDWVSAACLLVKREVLRDVGLLDERFALYLVDVDWCRQIKSKGWQVWYDPTSAIIHHEHKGGTRSSRAQAIRMATLMQKAAYRYYCKHHLRESWHPMRLVALFGLGLKAAMAVSGELVRGRRS